MRDTTTDVEAVRLQAVRQRPPTQRLRDALDWSEAVRTLSLRRLAEVHPELSRLALVELLLGKRLLPDEAASGE